MAMNYKIDKSKDIKRLWLVKNESGNIVKYAYSKEEADKWVLDNK